MTHRILLSAVLAAVAAVGCQSDTKRPTPTRFHSPGYPAAASRPTSRPASLADRLSEILNRHAAKGAIVSARVIDPETGRELFAQEIDRPMTPASNMKIAVSAAALEFFGPDFEFPTFLGVSGNDLYLVGTGDPATGDEPIAKKNKVDPLAFIDKWADELKAKGKTSFDTLYYDDSAFEAQQVHPDWAKGDLTEWYGAPVGGLNLNSNCIDVTAEPAAKAGEPATLSARPATTDTIKLVNETKTVLDKTTTKPSDAPEITRAQDENTYTIKGSVWEKTALESKPVTNPGAFFADAVKTRLAAKGITVGKVEHGNNGKPPIEMLTPAKTKFRDVLWRVMKNSQNLYAEGTAKQLGRWVNQQPPASRTSIRGLHEQAALGSWTNAEKAVRTFLAKHDIDDSHYVFADGSGLSGANKVTIRLVSDVFVAMYKSPNYEVWKNSLTIAGVDGTTRKRLADKPNRVFCKTGFISGVRSLSGYVVTDSGKTLVFSFIYNKITPRGSEATKPYEALQDEALRVLMAQ